MGRRVKFTRMKVPRQCPLVLLVKVGCNEAEAHLILLKISVRTSKRTPHFTILNINLLTVYRNNPCLHEESNETHKYKMSALKI
jgi:hypothetical protein